MPSDDYTAQDVIDALRFAMMAQKDPVEVFKLLNTLIEYAPETESDRGITFLLELITEGILKVALV